MFKRTFAAIAAMTILASACAEEETPNTSSRLRDSGTGTASTGLTQAYASQCARCHGDRGEGGNGGLYPALPGSRDESGYITIVRAGKDGTQMPAFTATDISDADLKADYATLKAR